MIEPRGSSAGVLGEWGDTQPCQNLVKRRQRMSTCARRAYSFGGSAWEWPSFYKYSQVDNGQSRMRLHVNSDVQYPLSLPSRIGHQSFIPVWYLVTSLWPINRGFINLSLRCPMFITTGSFLCKYRRSTTCNKWQRLAQCAFGTQRYWTSKSQGSAL